MNDDEAMRPTPVTRSVPRRVDLLLVRVAQSDPRAVRESIDQFGSLIWSISRRLTRTRAEAQDAVQEIFTDVWRSAGQFDPAQGSQRMFVTMIVRRRLIDRRRTAHRSRQTESDAEIDSATWVDLSNHTELCFEAQFAVRAVMQVRPGLRQVLELGVLQGLSFAEIAGVLRFPLGTVKAMMTHGLVQVHELMHKGAPR